MEALLRWVYMDQMAHRVLATAAHMLGEEDLVMQHSPGMGRTNAASMARRVVGLVDGDGIASACLRIHPDAAQVHARVLLMGREVAGRVIRCSSTGTRPDWLPDERWGLRGVAIEPTPKRGPKFEVIHDTETRQALYCPLELWGNLPEWVAAARDHYRIWWGAVDALREEFQRVPASLTEHVVMAFSAPACPWADKAAKKES